MEAFAVLLVVLGGAAFIALSMAVRGFVLKYLWLWFLTPLGVPALGIAQALGIALLCGLMCKDHDYRDDKVTGEKVAGAAISPLLALLIGWIIHSFT